MILRSLFAALLGLLIGAAAALFLVFGPVEFGGVKVGPWRTNMHIGSPDAPGIVRSIIARRGLLAMSREETVYFSADADSEGRALDEACDYRVVFTTQPDARWWSLTLYAEDDFLPVNGLEAHSVSAQDAGDQQSFIVTVSRQRAEGFWVSPENGGAFNLTLRLYNPSEAIVADPGVAVLPTVERVRCGGAS
ncbi:DUF1214 domain-containing protein [Maricaulis sp.]|uniref:DUF1214 domain-containing protein n=1 Tax=Maricaulis sp. TaxID=1486257 RepID=UPI00261C4BB9|nr:DUF1214 domain-containing protein [Maricaulis sp.]